VRLREKMSQGYTKASEGVSSVVARGSEAFEEGRDAFEKARQASTEQSGFGSLGPDYPSSRGI
jgi:hypothetical protein